MLCPSRKSGECIDIGDGIFLKVLSVNGDKVRLGFVAPREISIVRSELDGARGVEAFEEDRKGKS